MSGGEEREATLTRVLAEVAGSESELRRLLHAVTEYAATFADVAATATSTDTTLAPAVLVQALARMDGMDGMDLNDMVTPLTG